MVTQSAIKFDRIEEAFKKYPPSANGTFCAIVPKARRGTVQCAIGALALFGGVPKKELIDMNGSVDVIWDRYGLDEFYGINKVAEGEPGFIDCVIGVNDKVGIDHNQIKFLRENSAAMAPSPAKVAVFTRTRKANVLSMIKRLMAGEKC